MSRITDPIERETVLRRLKSWPLPTLERYYSDINSDANREIYGRLDHGLRIRFG